ncbi:TetR/AcrR family transcriptional regulator [Acidothermaceae bacterium B102]|nr:TetR/AcrR family transcriptional regulator [Acidothermaceae bacterium B102]
MTTSTPRVTAQGQATRARIVSIAAELMSKQGVARTSIDDVRGAAGVSASQIYHYFGDKAGLVRAVIGFQIDATLDYQRPILDHLDSIEALEAWRDKAIANQRARHCEGGCDVGSLASELVETSTETRQDLMVAFERWESPVREGLRAMHARGELRADADPDYLATALLAAVQGGVLLTQIRRDTTPLRAAMDAVIGHIRSLTTR